MNQWSKRLKKIRSSLDKSQAGMIESTSLVYQTYSKYERGEGWINEEYMHHLANNLRVNLSWLMTGQGEMFMTDTPATEGANDAHYQFIIEGLREQITHYKGRLRACEQQLESAST